MRFLRDVQKPCRRASYYRSPDRGTRRGMFSGTFESKRKVYLGSLFGPRVKGHRGPVIKA